MAPQYLLALTPLLFLGCPLRALADSPAAQALIARAQQEKSPVWADGDSATFFYRGPADQVEVLFGGDVRPLQPVAGSDVWFLRVDLKELDKAVFAYRFLPTTGDPKKVPAGAIGVWRGRNAPPPVAETTQLRGKLQTTEIASRSLASRRKLTIYLPPGHDLGKPTPVIYAADGEATPRFARVLEPLMVAGRVPAMVYLGVHSGGYEGGPPDFQHYDPKKDLRAQEYFPGLNAKRFADHEAFFGSEVPAWAQANFGVSSRPADRLIFGYSNGGRFAVEMGLRHPQVFGQVLAFSVAGNGTFEFPKEGIKLSDFFLMAGTWETHFQRCTESLANQLKARGTPVQFSSRVGGHDEVLWREELTKAINLVLGQRASPHPDNKHGMDSFPNHSAAKAEARKLIENRN